MTTCFEIIADTYGVLLSNPQPDDVVVKAISETEFDAFLASVTPPQKAMLQTQNVTGKAGQASLLYDQDGRVDFAIIILGQEVIWQTASAMTALPARRYSLDEATLSEEVITAIMLGAHLAFYQVAHATKQGAPEASLHCKNLPEEVVGLAKGIYLCRDLINAPANVMTPERLAQEATALADHHQAEVTITTGDQLAANYPAIHIVGRAAEIPPCLIDMRWGKTGPLITLVGKGVTFDSGGLDLKPSKAMEMMKKDMGGAAHVLGLASAIMESGLNLRLRVLIGAAENAVSQLSMRPMDVIDTRAGIKVEVGNTDAEGRLVLADALDLACEEEPDFLVDFATLTGAARVALGTECPALFCNHDETAKQIMACGKAIQDPLWQLPLFEPYDSQLDGGHMALSSTGSSGYGGAITAALFLRRFTGKDINWAHIDVMAWMLGTKPGRPKGGEAMGLRAIYAYIKSLSDA